MLLLSSEKTSNFLFSCLSYGIGSSPHINQLHDVAPAPLCATSCARFPFSLSPQSSRRGLAPVLSHYRSCGSASGGSVDQRCAYALHYLFLTLSVLIFYSQFPTSPQISNLFRATAILKYQLNSVCLIPTVKPFPPSTFINFFGTTA